MRGLEFGQQPDAHTGVSVGFPNFFRTHAIGEEYKSVGVNWSGKYRLKGDNQFRGFGTGGTHQIYVHGRAMRRIAPSREQQRALEHEPVSMRGAAEAVEQPFHPVLHQHVLERFLALVGKVQQPLSHRGRKVLNRRLDQIMLSR